MNPQDLLAELTTRPLTVVCNHGAWASATVSAGTWVCKAGFRHEVQGTIAVRGAYLIAEQAWNDYNKQPDPVLLVEFRRCQRELWTADGEARRTIPVAIARAAIDNASPTTRFLAHFIARVQGVDLGP